MVVARNLSSSRAPCSGSTIRTRKAAAAANTSDCGRGGGGRAHGPACGGVVQLRMTWLWPSHADTATALRRPHPPTHRQQLSSKSAGEQGVGPREGARGNEAQHGPRIRHKRDHRTAQRDCSRQALGKRAEASGQVAGQARHGGGSGEGLQAGSTRRRQRVRSRRRRRGRCRCSARRCLLQQSALQLRCSCSLQPAVQFGGSSSLFSTKLCRARRTSSDARWSIDATIAGVCCARRRARTSLAAAGPAPVPQGEAAARLNRSVVDCKVI